MPKDTNKQIQPQFDRETEILNRRLAVDAAVKEWQAVRQEPIDTAYKEAMATIPAKLKEVEEQAKERWTNREKEIKEIWEYQKKRNRREFEEKKISLNADYAKLMAEISTRYNMKSEQLDQEYIKASAEVERQLNEKAVQQKQEKAKLEADLAKAKKNNEKKLKEINKNRDQIFQQMDDLMVEINKKGRKGENTKDLEHEYDDLYMVFNTLGKEMSVQVSDEQYLNDKIEKLNASLDPKKLEEEMKARKTPLFNQRNEKRAALDREQQKELTEKKTAMIEEIDKAEEWLKKNEWRDQNPVFYAVEKDKNEKWEQDTKAYEEKLITDAANQKKEAAEKELQENSKKLLDRMYRGADLGVDAQILTTSSKKGKKPNTAEFTAMTDALDKVVKAAGKCDLSAEIDAEVHQSCLDAYKQCQNYLKAKKDEGFLHNYFRSGEGKERIRMANEMLTKLKNFYPELEQTLEAGQDAVKEQKAPAKPKHKEPQVDVKAKVDAAKAELAKQNGKKNGKKNGKEADKGKENQKQKVKAAGKGKAH